MRKEQYNSVSALYRLAKWNVKKRLGAKTIGAHTEFGTRLLLDFADQSAPHIFFNNYEREETELMRSYVKTGMTVLDIGANIGYFTLLLGQMVGPTGAVWAFEPNPGMTGHLVRNIDRNRNLRDGRIRVQDIALGFEEAETDFFSPVKGYEGVGGLQDTNRAPLDRVYRVRVVRLDRWIQSQEIQRVDFIKMDVEGGELDIFRGAEHLLTALRPVILFEASELNTAAYHYNVRDILEFVRQRNYNVQPLSSGYNFLARPKT